MNKAQQQSAQSIGGMASKFIGTHVTIALATFIKEVR